MLTTMAHPISTLTAREALSLILIDKLILQEPPTIDGAARIAAEVMEKYGKRINVTALFDYWQETLDNRVILNNKEGCYHGKSNK